MTKLMEKLIECSRDEIDEMLLENKADLRDLQDEELVELVNRGLVKNRELTDSWICPTCWDKAHNFALYGDNTDKTVFEDAFFEVFLVGNPRDPGHLSISTKAHYQYYYEAPRNLRHALSDFVALSMLGIKEVYGTECEYPCMMCDGRKNHLHVQIIPRYKGEERGCEVFSKKRKAYVDEPEKVEKLREFFKAHADDLGYITRPRCFPH
jgi:diadenosine tetraphosphate (Ap4A) HIT family hydrolase